MNYFAQLLLIEVETLKTKKMKKLFLLLAMSGLLFSFGACNSGSKKDNANQKIEDARESMHDAVDKSADKIEEGTDKVIEKVDETKDKAEKIEEIVKE